MSHTAKSVKEIETFVVGEMNTCPDKETLALHAGHQLCQTIEPISEQMSKAFAYLYTVKHATEDERIRALIPGMEQRLTTIHSEIRELSKAILRLAQESYRVQVE